MIIVLCHWNAEFSPRPRAMQEMNRVVRVAELALQCEYAGAAECPAQIKDAFEFYNRIAFSRARPHSEDQYKVLYGSGDTVASVAVKVEKDEPFVIGITSEAYLLTIVDNYVVISSPSAFGAIRGLATLAFLPYMSDQHQEDEKYYDMKVYEISDTPYNAFRSYTLDGAGKFVKLEAAKRTIDAISLQKLNVLIFKCGGVEHLPVRFTGARTKKFISGSFSKLHYYDLEDLTELQRYAKSRGVVVIPQIVIPGGAGPFRKVNRAFVADCPTAAHYNHYNIALNPTNAEVIDDIAYAFIELIAAFFPENLGIAPIIHLSGEMPAQDCWKADVQLMKHCKDKMMDPERLHLYFYEQLLARLKDVKSTFVLNEDLLQIPRESMPSNVIIHFTKTKNKSQVNAKNLSYFSSTGYGLHEMHPNGGHHYFYQDTWMDVGQQPCQGSTSPLCLGGSIEMPAANCWDESCMQHAFDRGIIISEIFWSGSSADVRRLQNTGCKVYYAVGYSGPLDIGQPCLGY